jgi:hypothetical protein
MIDSYSLLQSSFDSCSSELESHTRTSRRQDERMLSERIVSLLLCAAMAKNVYGSGSTGNSGTIASPPWVLLQNWGVFNTCSENQGVTGLCSSGGLDDCSNYAPQNQKRETGSSVRELLSTRSKRAASAFQKCSMTRIKSSLTLSTVSS